MTRCDPFRSRRLSGALSTFRARRRFKHAFGNVAAGLTVTFDADTRRATEALGRARDAAKRLGR